MNYKIKINSAVKKDYFVFTQTKELEDAFAVAWDAVQCKDVSSVEIIKLKKTYKKATKTTKRKTKK